MCIDFSQRGHARTIWQRLRVAEYWEHYNRPPGQRFLGSIWVDRQKSDELLDMTAENLHSVRFLTFRNLCERFDTYDPQQYWVQIITLALSEYAYYDESNTGFWQGLCDRLQLNNTQGLQNTLRAVVQQGSDLLGLISIRDRRNAGVRCVSTLCLQSGIPEQNLGHFAQLLEKLTQQYDWWEIAHTEPEDLSQVLYESCQSTYPQWGRLLTFLRYSCADGDEDAQPISGELIQGLATVAQALKRRDLSPTVLKDEQQRQQHLQDFCLPSTFFLRNWDNLIKVLTPRLGSSTRQRIVSSRKKPLLLMLDIADSMDIQLVLSAQTFRQSDLRGTYAQIRECNWETTLSMEGVLEIPELTLPIHHIEPEWSWHLRSHNRSSLREWRCQGVTSDFPVLFFDAWTGDRILPNHLQGITEIICFHSRTVQLELSDGIEVIDSFVPCSISGWRGQQLYLPNEQAQLTLCISGSSQVIQWNQAPSEYPQLRGLKLKQKKVTYLKVPSIWYPPITESRTIKLEIEDIDNREVLTEPNQQLPLSPNSNWQEISLSRWIKRSGTYLVKLWFENERWSEQFTLQSSFVVEPPIQNTLIQVCDRTNHPIEIPCQASSTTGFWLEELTLKNLWPLEDVRFLISNGQDEHHFIKSASTSGNLCLNLAVLRDTLPESDCYELSYQRLGEEWQGLLQTSTRGPVVSYTWAQQAIHLSRLNPEQSYTLSFWNLLRPDQALTDFSVNSCQENLTISLLDLLSNVTGIFYVQLRISITSIQPLGWWSNILNVQNFILPDEFDDLFDYCMNLLQNESAYSFSEEIRTLELDIDPEILNEAIAALNNDNYCLPEWIDINLLNQKLQVFLDSMEPKSELESEPEPDCDKKPQALSYSLEMESNNFSNVSNTIRKSFCKRFSAKLRKNHLEQSIELIKDKVLKDLLQVKVKDRQYLPKMEEIIADVGSTLHISIRLIEWES